MIQRWLFLRHVRSCHSFNFILNVATMQMKQGLQISGKTFLTNNFRYNIFLRNIFILSYYVTAFAQPIVDNSKNISTFWRVNQSSVNM